MLCFVIVDLFSMLVFCLILLMILKQGVQCSMVLVVIFFPNFEIIIFCFVVAIFDLVHDLEAIHDLSGNLF